MKKIMFNDKYRLTKAVLDGRKTQTRRIIKPQPILDKNVGITWKGNMYGLGCTNEETIRNFLRCVKPPYQAGEIIAVAQPYKDIFSPDETLYVAQGDGYRMVKAKNMAGWNNKLYVCADLMPHQIYITNVRFKQLQEISDEECIKEGVRNILNDQHFIINGRGEHSIVSYSAKIAYVQLMDKISGKGTWDSDPWVWVYEFELVK